MNRPQRKRYRLPWHDYSSPGYYYVTICAQNLIEYFGKRFNNRIYLNKFGQHAKKCWNEIPDHFPNVGLDEYIIMPNHIHGIIRIKYKTTKPINTNKFIYNKTSAGPQSRNLASIIRGFKIGVTKYARNHRIPFQWQYCYYPDGGSPAAAGEPVAYLACRTLWRLAFFNIGYLSRQMSNI